jgi:hypothetical protein
LKHFYFYFNFFIIFNMAVYDKVRSAFYGILSLFSGESILIIDLLIIFKLKIIEKSMYDIKFTCPFVLRLNVKIEMVERISNYF